MLCRWLHCISLHELTNKNTSLWSKQCPFRPSLFFEPWLRTPFLTILFLGVDDNQSTQNRIWGYMHVSLSSPVYCCHQLVSTFVTANPMSISFPEISWRVWISTKHALGGIVEIMWYMYDSSKFLAKPGYENVCSASVWSPLEGTVPAMWTSHFPLYFSLWQTKLFPVWTTNTVLWQGLNFTEKTFSSETLSSIKMRFVECYCTFCFLGLGTYIPSIS